MPNAVCFLIKFPLPCGTNPRKYIIYLIVNECLRPYVPLPDFLFLTDQNLQYLDVLVYTALRWFNKVVDRECFPMHETVGQLAGLSKRFVIDSIKRLEDADIITVKRSEKKRESNFYFFAKPKWNDRLEKIPKDFFELTRDLGKCERAMLLCLRQFFNNIKYECHEAKPVDFFAKWLGLTKDQVRKQFSALVEKSYITERFVISKYSAKARRFYKLSDKVDWNYEEYEQVTSFSILKVA
jgi:hypothetical protein